MVARKRDPRDAGFSFMTGVGCGFTFTGVNVVSISSSPCFLCDYNGFHFLFVSERFARSIITDSIIWRRSAQFAEKLTTATVRLILLLRYRDGNVS
jgi:hypothetical protein